MNHKVICPFCQKVITVTEDIVGTEVSCPFCGYHASVNLNVPMRGAFSRAASNEGDLCAAPLARNSAQVSPDEMRVIAKSSPAGRVLFIIEMVFLLLAPAACAIAFAVLCAQWERGSSNFVAYIILAGGWLVAFLKSSPEGPRWRGIGWVAAVTFCSTMAATGMLFIVLFRVPWAGFWVLLTSAFVAACMLGRTHHDWRKHNL
jgi:hypothetical protein